MGILTEEELSILTVIVGSRAEIFDDLKSVISSHRAIQERNRNLVLENDEQTADLVKAKELIEWAARIIDSGMGAGILRYDPVQFFIEYHTYLKALEELK